MRIHGDAQISGSAAALNQALEKVKQSLDNGWKVYTSTERLHGDYHAFECSQLKQRPAAILFMTSPDKATSTSTQTLSVVQVVPKQGDGLTADEYNGIIDEFYNRFIVPAAQGLPLKTELNTQEKSLQDYMSPTTADLLESFSQAANKSTGSSHPSDKKRWNAFLIAAHRDNSSLDSTTLQKWLLEEGGWGDRTSSDLTIEYERARELLKQYDEVR